MPIELPFRYDLRRCIRMIDLHENLIRDGRPLYSLEYLLYCRLYRQLSMSGGMSLRMALHGAGHYLIR